MTAPNEPSYAHALDSLVRRQRNARRPGGRGRIVMFMSGRDDATRSAVARAFAQLSAQQNPRPVWLIDLDLTANPQFDALERQGIVGAAPDDAYDLSLGRAPFWSVTGADGQARPTDGVVSLNRVSNSQLYVSRCHREAVGAGATVTLEDAPEYWRAARRAADLIVLDAPARSRSAAGLALARRTDAVIVTVANHGAALAEGRTLREEIEARDGTVAGAVLVDAEADAGPGS